MANTNGMAGDEIGAMYARMANRVETFATQSENFFNIITWLKNGTEVNGGVLTLDRLQLKENHEVAILPVEPPDTPSPDTPCVKKVTEAFAKAGDDKTPLADLQDAGKPELAEVNNGSSD